MHCSSEVEAPAAGAERTTPVTGRAARPLPPWALGLLGTAAVAVLSSAVWAAAHLQPDSQLRTAALFLHLISLVIGLGAVMAVDWFALLWLLGRRSLTDLIRIGAAIHLPIWAGLIGLVLSGALLRPDLSTPLTWVKLSLVLLVTLNGLHAYAVEQRLVQLGPDESSRRLIRRAGLAAAMSQVGWWGATSIGFVNTAC